MNDIEAVARALVQRREQDGGPPWGWYEMDRHKAAKELIMEEARAAIETIIERWMEPSEPAGTEMLSEMNDCIYTKRGYVGLPADAPERALRVYLSAKLEEIKRE